MTSKAPTCPLWSVCIASCSGATGALAECVSPTGFRFMQVAAQMSQPMLENLTSSAMKPLVSWKGTIECFSSLSVCTILLREECPKHAWHSLTDCSSVSLSGNMFTRVHATQQAPPVSC